MQLKLISVIEEQLAVRFTGRVNILSTFNRQYLGHFLFKDGEVIQAVYKGKKGLKAFFQVVIDEFALQSFQTVVEPEIVDEKERQIHYPYQVIKSRFATVLKQYRESLKLRPPEKVKILINSEILTDSLPITPEEFEVLKVLTDWNSPNDIYQHCDLMEHEITMALVGLRKKDALKIIASKNNL